MDITGLLVRMDNRWSLSGRRDLTRSLMNLLRFTASKTCPGGVYRCYNHMIMMALSIQTLAQWFPSLFDTLLGFLVLFLKVCPMFSQVVNTGLFKINRTLLFTYKIKCFFRIDLPFGRNHIYPIPRAL